MISPAASSFGASVAGVSPDSTTNSTVVASSEAGAVSELPRSSRTRSDTNPIWSALGLSHAHGTTTARTSGRATVRHDEQHGRREREQEQQEARDAAEAAAPVAVPLVPALVAGPRPYRPVRW